MGDRYSMKFKHSMSRPKKPKKVTLERIREIVREELMCMPEKRFPETIADAIHNLNAHGSFMNPIIRPVLPPPGVPARYKDPNRTNLPDGFQSNTEEPE